MKCVLADLVMLRFSNFLQISHHWETDTPYKLSYLSHLEIHQGTFANISRRKPYLPSMNRLLAPPTQYS